MAIPWMIALKVIPWGDVIEHAPKVLQAARKLLERQRTPQTREPVLPEHLASAPPPSLDSLNRQLSVALLQLDQQAQAQEQLTQTLAELAEQNARLVSAVDVLRLRTRLLMLAAFLNALMVGWLLLR
jgi:hypothetical protein